MADSKVEASNVKVMVRMRLFNKREVNLSKEKKKELRPCVKMRGNTCALVEYHTDEKGFQHEREREAFDFDECFWSMPLEQYAMTEKEYATQAYVYSKSGLLALKASLEGFHVCIFAYGQTGSGKTYSMLGSPSDPGISPRLVDDLFLHMERNHNPAIRFSVECMFYEIYNEKVRDLFNKKSKTGEYDNPRIRTDRIKGVYVEGLLRKECTDAAMTKELISKGTQERAIAETKMNATSSRSHAIFQISITQMDGMRGTKKTAYINLVDLAGSERVRQSQVTGASLVEATNINKSLSTLRRVIDILIENSTNRKQQVPPFRDSVLTYVLSESLGGNSKTQMIATISPHEDNMEDTISTLRYALRAKSIVCEARVNEEESAAMMQNMRDEIMRLRIQMRDGISLGGEGGAGVVPEEVQRELAEKEAEMAKMEEEQNKMESLMAKLRSEMAAMDQAKQELAVVVTEQKRERFAAAFRNAFMISSDKKRIREHISDLTNLREECAQLTRDLKATTAELRSKTDHNEHLLKENQHLSDAVQHLRAELDAVVATHEAKSRHHEELKAALEQQLKSNSEQTQELTAETDRQRRRIVALTNELTGLTHTAERDALEKKKLRSGFEQSAMGHIHELEQLRRKYDALKITAAEERERAVALQRAATTHQEERASLLETIRALQALIREKEFLIQSAHSEAEDARRTAEHQRHLVDERDQAIASLKAALTEYESSALQWMSDLSLRDREISRLSAITVHDPSSRVNPDIQALRDAVSYKAALPYGATLASSSLPASTHRVLAAKSSTPHRHVLVQPLSAVSPYSPSPAASTRRTPTR